MPSPRISVPGTIPAPLVEGLTNLRSTLGIPTEFPPAVLAEAERAAETKPVIGRDMTDVPFITIDPPTSMDLDQAMHIERKGDGFVVHYAIANVAAWVTPGGAIDEEAHERGVTYYAPGNNAPLHPTVLSHGAASLLADGVARPAYVWTMEVDAQGECTSSVVERAMVTSTAKLDYEGQQKALDAGTAIETIQLLREVGKLREAQEAARGGASLPIPEQDVEADGDAWTLSYRTPLPIEGWNAQISLMTGMEAARLMRGAKIGILRTLPPAEAGAVAKLRRAAKALHLDWPAEMGYPEFLRTLDRTKSSHKAMLNQCTTLFRGAGYMGFDGALPPEDHKHNALAAYYAHTTAPLRRLVDRYALETCACICAAEPVPAWVREGLPLLPQVMEMADRREKKYERGIVDLVEALILSKRVGETFHATVLESDGRRGSGIVLLDDPAVEAPARGRLPFGGEVQVRLASVDVALGKVSFEALQGGRPADDRQGQGRDGGQGKGGQGRDAGTPRRRQQDTRGRRRGPGYREGGSGQSNGSDGLPGRAYGQGERIVEQAARGLRRGFEGVRRGVDAARRGWSDGAPRNVRRDNGGDGDLPGKPYGR